MKIWLGCTLLISRLLRISLAGELAQSFASLGFGTEQRGNRISEGHRIAGI